MARTFVVIDDHEAVLSGTVAVLQKEYPDAQIITASGAKEAEEQIAGANPDAVVMDLSIPHTPKDSAQTETGLQLLRMLMEIYPTLNIVVQSAHVRSLVRIKPLMDLHEGGLTIADKGLPLKEMLKKVDWALQGLMYTPREMRVGLAIKPEWLKVLMLAFQDGLQDKAIAEKMNISERTVRHYWTKVQDALDVYPESGKNIRIQTEIRAREEGLID
ncbi:MAG: response regulator transcription factor [Cyanobacteria bacterium P01_F01_bin.150]